ncbi:MULTISPECIES: L-aspartate oxidase [unclassified Bradyrhizobium]|uniref:L-aspartate oxidase n=1 Tax=unclassified Bradyrhizobium TaxID=2631580 RepID=UPI001CD52D4D|nr:MULTISPECIES: L-aspartate oxidase [unclassified Bradyrhizobium]MCA1373921.1 L-aspartate oxidase [Bradyrhizobium sp. IC4060]MCA1488146.1 L-aspartate oxidase [Bradyrhizobium sp. IC4061]MCA1540280.1 L-aspartate oxidase [Bradyrhizobium sp. NBAIM32]
MQHDIYDRARADDVVIVGGGLAGLFCALKLAPRPVTLISAAPLGHGASSAWAQGGIAAAVAEGDTPEAHGADTVAVGGGLVDEAVALGIAREAAPRIHDLLAYGVPFDRDLDGRLAVGREAAHSASRIVHVRGDGAGAAIIAALSEAARRTPSIRLMEGFVAEALLTEDGAVTGLQLRDAGNPAARPLVLASRAVVLATGGLGHLYAVTTNPSEASGSGLAIAARAGAVIADPEFVQFHPTAIMVGRDPAPLATEALRGEGATLINGNGERFMSARHPLAELAPRDIVARGVFAEIAAGRGAFLDARQALGARFATSFPTVHASCIAADIDPAAQPIPIATAAHYHMGGIAVDARGRSSIDGLWAAGEVSSTGAHGANRLASNSLLEAVVYAARIADDIAGRTVSPPARLPDSLVTPRAGTPDAAEVKRLRAMMSAHVGVIRDGDGLAQAVRHFARLEREAGHGVLGNMAISALLVAVAAWTRHESRGAHYRSDHSAENPALAQRTMTTLAAAREVAESLDERPRPRLVQSMIA